MASAVPPLRMPASLAEPELLGDDTGALPAPSTPRPARSDWTAPGNLDLVLRTDDLVERVTVENYNDVRLTLGDGVTLPSGRDYALEVLGARSGVIDASGLDGGLALALSHARPGAGGSNGFSIIGSGFDDRLAFRAGAGDGAGTTILTDAGGDVGHFALSLAYGYDDGPNTAAMLADWFADGARVSANGRITSHHDGWMRMPSGGLGVDGATDHGFEIDSTDVIEIAIGGAFAGQKATKVTIDFSLFYEHELSRTLGPDGFEAATVTLFDGARAVFSTLFASDSGDRFGGGRSPGLASLEIDSEGAFAFDRVSLRAVDDWTRSDPHDFLVRGVTFEGAFGTGGDEIRLGPAQDIVTYDATDAANRLDTVLGFMRGSDSLRIDTETGGGEGVAVAELGGDTVFTFAADPAKAIILRGVTGLAAGEDYVFV